MTRKTRDVGWSVEPELVELDPVGFDEQTRVAPSGLLGESVATAAGECAPDAVDATRMARPAAGKGASTLRRTAEFHPRSGGRATGEVTMQWSENRMSAGAFIKDRFSQIKVSFQGRARLVALGVFAALSVAAALGATGRQKTGARSVTGASERDVLQSSSENPLESSDRIKPADGANDQKTKEAVEKPDARLKDAADALAEGRLEEALAIYEDLLAASPENESFSLAVEILSERPEGARR